MGLPWHQEEEILSKLFILWTLQPTAEVGNWILVEPRKSIVQEYITGNTHKQWMVSVGPGTSEWGTKWLVVWMGESWGMVKDRRVNCTVVRCWKRHMCSRVPSSNILTYASPQGKLKTKQNKTLNKQQPDLKTKPFSCWWKEVLSSCDFKHLHSLVLAMYLNPAMLLCGIIIKNPKHYFCLGFWS